MRELDARANKLANALAGARAAQGRQGRHPEPQHLDYGAVFFGVARTGYVLVNVSVLYAPEELTFVLNKADTDVLIFDPFLAEKVEAVREDTPRIRKRISHRRGSNVPDAQTLDDFIRDAPATPPHGADRRKPTRSA